MTGIERLPLAALTARRGLSLASRIAIGTGERLRRQAIKLDQSYRPPEQPIEVKAIGDIPSPRVDLAADDPIAAIMAAPEFGAATEFFADNPAATRSLVSACSQALLYSLLRNLRPDHVFEIGCYKAGTTEAICRALYANGTGMAHTVDPFCGEQIKAIFKYWPPELLKHVQLYTTDSMPFYCDQELKHISPALVFVDGNHAYEYALFDIGCAARALLPGGFIVIDNIAQAGPFQAAASFLAANPAWRELGSTLQHHNRNKAHDPHRTTIRNTDFMVLRAPTFHPVDSRPRSFGPELWPRDTVEGLRLKMLPVEQPGQLHVQLILRGFGAQLVEEYAEAVIEIAAGTDSQEIHFTVPARTNGEYTIFRVETWLIWRGPEVLRLSAAPEPF